ncbi:MAG: hypothetical protein AAB535_03780 [Patescibacteria group bacterium]
MKIAELKKKYKNEWILAEVIKEDKLNQVTEANPIAHSGDRSVVYKELTKVKGKKHVTTIYTGKLPQKGMVYAFNAKLKI